MEQRNKSCQEIGDKVCLYLLVLWEFIQREGQDGPVSLTWLPGKFESIFKMAAILDSQSERFYTLDL